MVDLDAIAAEPRPLVRWQLLSQAQAEVDALTARIADERGRVAAELYAAGESMAEVGRQLGVSKARVDQLIRRAGGADPDRQPRPRPRPGAGDEQDQAAAVPHVRVAVDELGKATAVLAAATAPLDARVAEALYAAAERLRRAGRHGVSAGDPGS